MTIGLANSAKRSRYLTETVNANQGGGDKKAGFAYQIGRGYMVENWFYQNAVNRPLSQLQNVVFPLATITRPIGRNNNRTYWDRGIPPP
jgi:hypothetical protein